MDNPDPRIERLSPRMRQCLGLVYARRTTKQIAGDLGLSPGTVDGYIAEAVRLLGARNRVEAAEMLHASDAAAGEPAVGPEPDPCIIHPRSSGVALAPPAPPVGGSGSAGTRWPLPIRTQGATGNDLSIVQRIGWILFLAIGIAVGIGGIANALRLASDVARQR